MAKIRCSNCEKGVKLRESNGIIVEEDTCKATGESISGKDYYQERKCEEFLSRIEYSKQFRTLFEKVMKGLAVGKEIKGIIK